MKNKINIKLTMFVVMAFLLLISVGAFAQSEADAKKATANKLVIKSKSGAKITISKAELTTRPGTRASGKKESRRVDPAASDPQPTVLKLTFPTLVYPGKR